MTRIPNPTILPTARLNLLAAVRLRVWAADLRDGSNPDLSGMARVLVNLLDVRGGLQADNARESVDHSIALLAGRLLVAGAPGPE
jgi:hypothetical protein